MGSEISLLPLAGVRTLDPPVMPVPQELLRTARGEIWQKLNDSYAGASDLAASLGAVSLAVRSGDEYSAAVRRDFPNNYLSRINQWTLEGNYRAYVEETFFATAEGRKVPRPETKTLAACYVSGINTLYDKLQDNTPFMVVMPSANRGHAKYLIEHNWQLDRVLRFCSEHPDSNWFEQFYYREYIQTPSNRFTTYRLLGTPNGVILAGGITYSAHDKRGSRKTIINDRHGEVSGPVLRVKQAFEDPRSPYFLAATDVRVNTGAPTGQGAIALTGPGALPPLTRQEEIDLVAAHGIDPRSRRLPDGVAMIAMTILRHMRPALDIVTGIDIIQGPGPVYYYLERNTDPGARMYAVCELGDGTDPSAMQAMRLAAVRSLRVQEHTLHAYLTQAPEYNPEDLEWVTAGPLSAARIPGSEWRVIRYDATGKTMPLGPTLWKNFMAQLRSGKFDNTDMNAAFVRIHLTSCPQCAQSDISARFRHQQLVAA